MEGFNLQLFNQLKKDVGVAYEKIKNIHCPALGAIVIFNADGFHHLRYDNNRSERSKQVQFNKFNCFRNVPNILELTTTIQEYRKMICPVGKPNHSGYRSVSTVEWFGFIAIINLEKKIRIRIIIRRIGEQDGNYHFWSVMPDWRLSGNFRVVGPTDMEDV